MATIMGSYTKRYLLWPFERCELTPRETQEVSLVDLPPWVCTEKPILLCGFVIDPLIESRVLVGGTVQGKDFTCGQMVSARMFEMAVAFKQLTHMNFSLPTRLKFHALPDPEEEAYATQGGLLLQKKKKLVCSAALRIAILEPGTHL